MRVFPPALKRGLKRALRGALPIHAQKRRANGTPKGPLFHGGANGADVGRACPTLCGIDGWVRMRGVQAAKDGAPRHAEDASRWLCSKSKSYKRPCWPHSRGRAALQGRVKVAS